MAYQIFVAGGFEVELAVVYAVNDDLDGLRFESSRHL